MAAQVVSEHGYRFGGISSFDAYPEGVTPYVRPRDPFAIRGVGCKWAGDPEAAASHAQLS